MTALKRFVLLLVLFGSITAASPTSLIAAADSKTVYEVWGKDVRDLKQATPENPDPGRWILLGSSDTRAGAEQTLVNITRHGGFVRLYIKETQVKIERFKEKAIGNVQKPIDDGLVQPKRPIEEIKPKPPAPKAIPRPKGSAVTPLLTKPPHKLDR